jgi:hypothetical protein
MLLTSLYSCICLLQKLIVSREAGSLQRTSPYSFYRVEWQSTQEILAVVPHVGVVPLLWQAMVEQLPPTKLPELRGSLDVSVAPVLVQTVE